MGLLFTQNQKFEELKKHPFIPVSGLSVLISLYLISDRIAVRAVMRPAALFILSVSAKHVGHKAFSACVLMKWINNRNANTFNNYGNQYAKSFIKNILQLIIYI